MRDNSEYFTVVLRYPGHVSIGRGSKWEELLDNPLEGSIRKWETVLQAYTDGVIIVNDGDVETCPLCAVYSHHHCDGCPISEYTNWTGCAGTPYVGRHYKSQARRELEFLHDVKEWVENGKE